MYPVYSDPYRDLVDLINVLETKPRYIMVTEDECDYLLDENRIQPIDEHFNAFEFEHDNQTYVLKVEKPR